MGSLLAIEGIDGAGKTTQAARLAQALTERGYDVLATREPGGTYIGDRIRTLLKDAVHRSRMDSLTSLLLFNAARRQWLHEVVHPALAEGKVVVTDRSYFSTLAYQGYGERLRLELVSSLCHEVMGTTHIDKVFLLDIPCEEMKRRLSARGGDRYEEMDLDFHERVRKGFLIEAAARPQLVQIIDGSRSEEEIAQELLSHALSALGAPQLKGETS